MTGSRMVWLASYPRSGNTFLRTILWQCFGLRSASIYPTDLGGKKALEDYVGHIEHVNGQITFAPGAVPLLKTHELPRDDGRAIYVIRNGKDACLSLWKFYDKKVPLEAVVRGEHRFGTWAKHVEAWHPWDRPNTLFLKYEDILADLPGTLDKLSGFLRYPIACSTLPDRNTIAGADGRWVKVKESSDAEFTDALWREFDRVNGEVSRRFGYVVNSRSEAA